MPRCLQVLRAPQVEVPRCWRVPRLLEDAQVPTSLIARRASSAHPEEVVMPPGSA